MEIEPDSLLPVPPGTLHSSLPSLRILKESSEAPPWQKAAPPPALLSSCVVTGATRIPLVPSSQRRKQITHHWVIIEQLKGHLATV